MACQHQRKVAANLLSDWRCQNWPGCHSPLCQSQRQALAMKQLHCLALDKAWQPCQVRHCHSQSLPQGTHLHAANLCQEKALCRVASSGFWEALCLASCQLLATQTPSLPPKLGGTQQRQPKHLFGQCNGLHQLSWPCLLAAAQMSLPVAHACHLGKCR